MRWSTAPAFILPLAYYEAKYNVKFPEPSPFCDKCVRLITSRFEGMKPRPTVCDYEQAVEQGSSRAAEFSEIGKIEGDVDGLRELSNEDLLQSEHDHGFGGRLRCILCNEGAYEEGISLQIKKSEADMDDLVVMFVLRKMLEIPGNKLQDFLSKVGQPKKWISSCVQCKTLILKAFQTQKIIEKLEAELRTTQNVFKEKVIATWNESEIVQETTQRNQPVSAQSRCYVATQEWPEIVVENEGVDIPPSFPLASPLPVEIKTEMVSSGGEDISDLDRDASTSEEELSSNEEWSSLVATAKTRDVKKSVLLQKYQCKLCPDLHQMKLHGFVQHILYHKRKASEIIKYISVHQFKKL